MRLSKEFFFEMPWKTKLALFISSVIVLVFAVLIGVIIVAAVIEAWKPILFVAAMAAFLFGGAWALTEVDKYYKRYRKKQKEAEDLPIEA